MARSRSIGRKKPAGTMNKTETAYSRFLTLSPDCASWWYEEYRFKVGASSWYTPDFVWLHSDGHLYADEVKGSKFLSGVYAPVYTEASYVRLRAAADRHWPLVFRLVYPDSKVPDLFWKFREVSP